VTPTAYHGHYLMKAFAALPSFSLDITMNLESIVIFCGPQPTGPPNCEVFEHIETR
jgi:hypothetical protein